jgi:NADPH:quinone reductase-like Zn-dependent oxidoreductase
MGAHAEFLCVSETGAIALKPENLNFEEAASIIFGGTTANYFLNRGNVAAGKKVLVYGASGSVGSAAVQLAKSRGAYVTAVCSTSNLALMNTLGADAVLDYTIPGFMDGTERYDVIFETVNKADIAGCVWNLTQIGH